MSINSVSANSQAYPPTAPQNALQQNFQALTQAIQSGNLSAAQSAYATLTQNAPAQGANGSGNNPFQQAIASIGTALSSGDIGSAQNALKGLQQTMKSHHGHHHHGAQSQDAGSTPQTASTTIAALPTTASAQVDISA